MHAHSLFAFSCQAPDTAGSQNCAICSFACICSLAIALYFQVNERSVLSIKGSLYILVGPIQHAKNMPGWFEERFYNGFPALWKSFVDEYLEWLSQRNSDDDSDGDYALNSTGS